MHNRNKHNYTIIQNISFRKCFVFFTIAILLGLGFGFEVKAQMYHPSVGTVTSTNLLDGIGSSLIDKFGYNASSIPVGTSSIKVRFSQDNTNWYNSSGVLSEWDTLSEGNSLAEASAIDLSTLGWTGAEFYYQAQFETTNTSITPVLDETRLYYKQYPLNGTYISGTQDFTTPVNFTTIDWDATVEAGVTSVKFQMAANNDDTTWNFVGPDGTASTYYETTGDSIWSGHNGNQYLRWKAYLETTDQLKTPELNSVTVNHENYPASATLTSSPYDTSDELNVIADITWTEIVSGDTSITFQMRTAPDDAGSPGVWTNWVGPDGAGTYFINPAGGENMPSEIATAEVGAGSNQWVQYRAYLHTTDGTQTPILDDVSVTYVVNAPPEFQANPSVVQVSSSEDESWGNVKIVYSVRDIDTATASLENQWRLTVDNMEYSLDDGLSWSVIDPTKILSGPNIGDDIDLGSNSDTWIENTVVWDAASQLTTYSNQAKIRITINDNEAANNIANATSAVFTLDTTPPTITAPTVDASQADVQYSGFICTDDSALQMRVGLQSDLSGSDWVSYSSSGTISADNGSTIYTQCRDAYDNRTSIESVTIPDKPDNVFWQDISDVEKLEWRMFVAWGVVDLPTPGFGQYNVWRSENGGEFVLHHTINERGTNYIADFSLSNTVEYSWKVTTEDSDGNISFFSDTVTHTPSGVGGTDIAPPTLSNVQIGSITPTTAKITWDSNKLSNSTVHHKASSEWPGTETVRYDNSVGVPSMVTSHEVVLTELTPSTTYFFIVQSTDISNNIGTSALEAYTFTTEPGPIISTVSVTSAYDHEVTITWNTNILADSQVTYSKNSDLSAPTSVVGTAETVTSHSITISNLDSGTPYYFFVSSTDGNGNTAEDRNVQNGVIQYHTFTTTIDTESPVISNTVTSLIAHNGVTITWETNESATSQVQWGTSTDLGEETAETSFYTTKHTVSIEDLDSETQYYYKVISNDKAGNATIDDNSENMYTFTTLEPEKEIQYIDASDSAPLVISQFRITDIMGDSAAARWSTNKAADAFLFFSTDQSDIGQAVGGTRSTSTVHHVPLTSLSPETTYYAQATGRDIYGNLGVSSVTSFTTTSSDMTAGEAQAVSLVERGSRVFIESILRAVPRNPHFPDISETDFVSMILEMTELAVSAPSISGPDISVEVSPRSALIRWVTSKNANSLVAIASEEEYNAARLEPYTTVVGSPSANVTNHAVTVTGLEPDTTYHYQIRSQSQLSSDARWEDRTFTTSSLTPEIVDVQFEDIRETEVVLTWETTLPTSTTVRVTNNSTGEVISQENQSFIRDHRFTITDLYPGTGYTLQVQAQDEQGNTSVSSLFPFFTFLSLDPPIVSNVRVTTSLIPGTPERVQTIFTWKTNKPSTSRILYQEGAVVDTEPMHSTPESSGHTMDHIVISTGLQPGTVYTFQAESVDSQNNRVLSSPHTISTPRPRENIIDLIYQNFMQTFSFLRRG